VELSEKAHLQTLQGFHEKEEEKKHQLQQNHLLSAYIMPATDLNT
jgi:hypothetical protein